MLHCAISFVQHVRRSQSWHLIKGANFPLRRRVRPPSTLEAAPVVSGTGRKHNRRLLRLVLDKLRV